MRLSETNNGCGPIKVIKTQLKEPKAPTMAFLASRCVFMAKRRLT